MSLPSGYKRLEYIKSSGTQYIKTGFKPNQNTKVSAVFQGNKTSDATVFGCDAGWGSNGFSVFANAAQFGSKTTSGLTFYGDTKISVIFDKGTLYKNDTQVWNTIGSFSSQNEMTLFANNRNGSAQEFMVGKMYSFKIYDNGTLVRDFIPFQTTDGTIGLWDDVNSVFYGNAGTGTFMAGPEIIPDPPAAPTGLQTVLAVVLQWAASANADRYDVYRDGAKLGSTEGTQYVDTTPEANQTYVYTVKAVNGGGESAGASITVYTKSGYFEYKPLIESANFP